MRLVFAMLILLLGSLMPLASYAGLLGCSITAASRFTHGEQMLLNKEKEKKAVEEEDEEPDCDDDDEEESGKPKK